MVALAPQAAEIAPLSAESVRTLSESKREPAWLLERRLQAWQSFQNLPMPTTTTDGWRRTDLRELKLGEVLPPQASASAGLRAAMGVKGQPKDAGGSLVHVNGGPPAVDLADALRRQGVVLVGIEEALERYPGLVRERFMSLVTPEEHKFAALHAALWSGGAFLYVPRGVAIELPIQSLSWYSEDRLGAFNHSLVVLEPEAQVTFVESFRSATDAPQAIACTALEIFLAQGSRLRYASLNEAGPERWTFHIARAVLERDAFLSWLMVAVGGRVTKSWVEARLVGTAAEVELRGLVFGEGRQHFDHYTLQDHHASRTRSDLNYKVALQDKARSNYSGMVRIGEEARQCDANQENRNLLLTDGAKADSDPKLEILNSEVIRAGHGATVGPVDPEQLYYAMTRGFSRASAEHLLVHAFFEPLLAKIPLASLRKRVWGSIERKLGAPPMNGQISSLSQ